MKKQLKISLAIVSLLLALSILSFSCNAVWEEFNSPVTSVLFFSYQPHEAYVYVTVWDSLPGEYDSNFRAYTYCDYLSVSTPNPYAVKAYIEWAVTTTDNESITGYDEDFAHGQNIDQNNATAITYATDWLYEYGIDSFTTCHKLFQKNTCETDFIQYGNTIYIGTSS